MKIRPVEKADFAEWLRLSLALWPAASTSEHEVEMLPCFQREKAAVFVAQAEDGRLVGFVEASIRYYADGCDTHDVGYIEGWFVEVGFRRQGIGAALVEAAENWARSKGCREMASDCLLGNDASLVAHLALGYQEKERLIHFAKPL